MERTSEGNRKEGRQEVNNRGLGEIMKIKDLSKVDRPREKFEKYGPEKLLGVSVDELLK